MKGGPFPFPVPRPEQITPLPGIMSDRLPAREQAVSSLICPSFNHRWVLLEFPAQDPLWCWYSTAQPSVLTELLL